MDQIIKDFCIKGIEWGPIFIILIIILFGLYKLVLKILKDIQIAFKDTGVRIVQALEKPSGALNQQAMSMDRLTQALHNYIARDLSEHREIIILQKLVLDKLERIGLKGERDDGAKKREI